jgi:phosphopentomutase
LEGTTALKPGKVVFIVLDGVGIGALPDAFAYGDEGAHTLGNTARALGGIRLPNLERFGLGCIADIAGVAQVQKPEGCYGKMAERSAGKDSTTGHWELGGLITEKAFPLYPSGFPIELLERFKRVTGCAGYLGNKPASGTEIIKELGSEHVRTGFPIVYTSGDSVFQIAAHEDVIPLKRLYEICEVTRKQILVGEHEVGRVIARPFVGTDGSFVRTTNRRDFALEPAGVTLLDLLSEEGIETVGVGKIDDLFCGRGLRQKIHTKSNSEGVRVMLDAAARLRSGFIMANLVDFDMLFGHRQDPKGMGRALEEFDALLPALLGALADGDLLLLTADHGNDPTDKSTDHSREFVPLLCSIKGGRRGVNLGVRSTFADSARTVADYFSLAHGERLAGNSFFRSLV